MGDINFKDGEVIVSEEYQEYITLGYENTISGLDVATIKNNYNQLFDLKEIGKEDKKTKKKTSLHLKKIVILEREYLKFQLIKLSGLSFSQTHPV